MVLRVKDDPWGDINDQVFRIEEGWAGAKRLTIVKARRLLKSLESTYDGDRYKDLPRRATQNIQERLTKASPRE